ncbi:hypothetical protein SAMN05216328_13424 [Ensifer sp. YR511]|nr:hypothetical protein SAMN05216328_13424 [Ensifer sp. YR511]
MLVRNFFLMFSRSFAGKPEAYMRFAVGDVHGRADLLETMLTVIAYLAARQRASYRVVFLGDDRTVAP